MKTLTAQDKNLFNSLLVLSYSNHHITLANMRPSVPEDTLNLPKSLSNLEANGLLMIGLEDTTEGDKITYTPLVNGTAYGHPCDEFKFAEWMSNELN
jgi:hypothetical protein|tara:strand:+ start:414 stop:704 length:291 start_codon:yes stop_codon:yes gene_type:complete